jgi:predicted DsbA family dithiol-disulfide isomerase
MTTDTEAAQVTTTSIKVDVWSDVACPWCYVGKRKFEAGAAAFVGAGEADGAATDGAGGRREVVVEYHSYELAPDTPVENTVNHLDYLVERLGVSRSDAVAMLARMVELGKTVGIAFDYDALQHTNTVKAHQLIHYAKAHGRQLDATERIFRAYFTEGRHVGRVAELADLAAEIGFDRADVARSLESDEYLTDVRQDQDLARRYGIRGVPFFVVDGKYGLSGAQDPAVFAQALEQVWTERDR